MTGIKSGSCGQFQSLRGIYGDEYMEIFGTNTMLEEERRFGAGDKWRQTPAWELLLGVLSCPITDASKQKEYLIPMGYVCNAYIWTYLAQTTGCTPLSLCKLKSLSRRKRTQIALAGLIYMLK